MAAFNPTWTQAECNLNGYFFCTIQMACLNKPLSGGGGTSGGGGISGGGTAPPRAPIVQPPNIIKCGIPGCAAIPSCIPGKFEKGTFDGYTWSATFPTNSVPTHIAETEFSTLNKIQNLHTEPSVVPNIEQCDCEHVPEYDPVYASIRMLTGSGIGYNRSRTVLCNASAENLGNITPEGCPIRELEYLVHINRITESHTINRSKNVKSKN